jgi:hypothetical protein
MTAGQLGGAAVIAVAGPFGYPAFAALYAASATLRVVAFRRADAAPRPRSLVAELDPGHGAPAAEGSVGG